MFYFILIVLFILVFGFLGWRILTQSQGAPVADDAYECPHCNEQDCVCHKKDE